MRLNKIIRKLKLKFYETNKNISNIIGSYNLVGSLIVLLTIILNFGFNDILIKQQNIINTRIKYRSSLWSLIKIFLFKRLKNT